MTKAKRCRHPEVVVVYWARSIDCARWDAISWCVTCGAKGVRKRPTGRMRWILPKHERERRNRG